jgi:hypothetical protein
MNWLTLDRELAASPRVRIALLALAASVFLFFAASVRALRIEPTPDATAPTLASGKTKTAPARGVQIDPEQVVEKDIFAIDRSAPVERYPMPGEEREKAPVVVTPPAARPAVLGTAVGVDGHAFATVQLPNTQPRIVRVGDKLGVFTIVAITRGTVTFRAGTEPPFQINAP